MAELSKHRRDIADQTEEQKTARNRMALFPSGEEGEVEILYVDEEMWVVSLPPVPSRPTGAMR